MITNGIEGRSRRVIVCARLAVLAGVSAAVIGLGPGAFANEVAQPISVSVQPTAVSTEVGATTDLKIEVTNNGSAATADLVVHLDITNPSLEGSVDPEDWTTTLTQVIGTIPAGRFCFCGVGCEGP